MEWLDDPKFREMNSIVSDLIRVFGEAFEQCSVRRTENIRCVNRYICSTSGEDIVPFVS